jgi:hypothetical protein
VVFCVTYSFFVSALSLVLLLLACRPDLTCLHRTFHPLFLSFYLDQPAPRRDLRYSIFRSSLTKTADRPFFSKCFDRTRWALCVHAKYLCPISQSHTASLPRPSAFICCVVVWVRAGDGPRRTAPAPAAAWSDQGTEVRGRGHRSRALRRRGGSRNSCANDVSDGHDEGAAGSKLHERKRRTRQSVRAYSVARAGKQHRHGTWGAPHLCRSMRWGEDPSSWRSCSRWSSGRPGRRRPVWTLVDRVSVSM